MSYHVRVGLRSGYFLIFAVMFALSLHAARGQEKKLKELQWSHAFDLACRKNDEKDITKDTKRWGVEAFRDNNTAGGIGLFISQTGSITLAPHFARLIVPLKPSKGPDWRTGLDMPTPKAGVLPSKGARIHNMEGFRDPHT